MQELQYDQISGDQEKIKANKDENVEINKCDAHLIHARIEARQYDVASGKKTSVPIVQNFYPHEFDSMEKQGAFQGKEVEIIHNPDGYVPAENKGDGKDNAGSGEKPISRMNKTELFAKYKEVYGEDAPADSKNDELKEAIELGLEKNKNPLGDQ